ncbi:MAG: hypothetical protein EWV78_04770 [Microcystis aeruginosa Ma_MB_F_20061100_S20D]|uniref:Clan AA aspartic protease n=1 Tax=Microcystis aeruginosa Ma_MB_F_20061100_S20D TaxID=2486253 RepID=A0A552EW00_MICAE|nr:MAG: hypothetical protein EWV78_04770 [Microcystis aeruginosa Ma_MB_F_20061100_S20D]
MEGVVNLRREATLRIVVGNSNRQLQAVDAVIDTGFNGFLSLPSTIIATLNLPWSGSDFVTLGDGGETYFDLYTGGCRSITLRAVRSRLKPYEPVLEEIR